MKGNGNFESERNLTEFKREFVFQRNTGKMKM